MVRMINRQHDRTFRHCATHAMPRSRIKKTILTLENGKKMYMMQGTRTVSFATSTGGSKSRDQKFTCNGIWEQVSRYRRSHACQPSGAYAMIFWPWSFRTEGLFLGVRASKGVEIMHTDSTVTAFNVGINDGSDACQTIMLLPQGPMLLSLC